MLHTVNKSPFTTSTLKSCLAHASQGDAVLLIEDGVLGVLKGTIASGDIWSKRVELKFYVLGPDAAARGITKERMIDGINIIDYADFVDLAEKHKSSQAWL